MLCAGSGSATTALIKTNGWTSPRPAKTHDAFHHQRHKPLHGRPDKTHPFESRWSTLWSIWLAPP